MKVSQGLGGGNMPLGARLYRQEIYAAITRPDSTEGTHHTYPLHPLGGPAAPTLLNVHRRANLVEQCRTDGLYLKEQLHPRFDQNPHVGDIRGRGLFLALELVEDRESKRPFPPSRKLADRVRAAALEEGLICYPSSGSVDGINGDHVLLSPPYIVSRAELDEMVDQLERALRKLELC